MNHVVCLANIIIFQITLSFTNFYLEVRQRKIFQISRCQNRSRASYMNTKKKGGEVFFKLGTPHTFEPAHNALYSSTVCH